MKKITFWLCFFVAVFSLFIFEISSNEKKALSYSLEPFSNFINSSFFTPAFADSAPISSSEISEIEDFFSSYVDSSNNYKDDLVDKYSENAIIKRVVIKNSGEKETVIIPIKRYFSELQKGKKLAKLVRYKNTYSNKTYEKISEDEYKIKTIRTPMRDKSGLRAYFIIKRTPNGLKISEEAMETTVQRFLEER